MILNYTGCAESEGTKNIILQQKKILTSAGKFKFPEKTMIPIMLSNSKFKYSKSLSIVSYI